MPLLLCDYQYYQYGYGGSKVRGVVHYNLHRDVGALPTVHLLVGGLVDNTDDWIDDDRRPRKYGRQEGARDEMFSWFISNTIHRGNENRWGGRC